MNVAPLEIAVLMACYNRRSKTLECLANLAIAAKRASVHYKLFVFDDGSSDGTAEAVQLLEPDATVIRGDGSYYWNRSMNRAFAAAMQVGFPAYLWLNDDTMLHPDAFTLLLSARDYSAPNESIVVGATCDPESGQTSYGGARFISPHLRPFLAAVVHPGPQPLDVDVMNGNVVLIPEGVVRQLGNLDPVFEHGMGDTDYSMRARKLGVRILLTAGYVGDCSKNSLKGSYRDKALPLTDRLRQLFSRKGLPWRSWLSMCWRHGGTLWPLHFFWGYFKVILGRV